MDQKSFIEGARAFTFWGAQLIDATSRSNDHSANGLISLLTPVIKGFLTDKGFEMTVQAQQIFWRTRLYRGMGHVTICARCTYSYDL